MIYCNKGTVQYIGKTKRHLSDSFGEQRRAIEKQHFDQPTAVSDHFTPPAHSMDNIELVPLELVTSNGDAIHKAREPFLISKTLEPSRLTRQTKFDLFIFLSIRFSTRLILPYFCQPIMSHISFSIIFNFVTVLSIFT